MSNIPNAKSVMNIAINRKYTAITLENNELYIEERRLFIDKFTVCDYTCKAYVENYIISKKSNKGKKIQPELNMRLIPNALKYFDVHIDERLLSNVFGSETAKGRRTCKKIRNGIVHAMKQSELEELHERYCELMNYMDEFLKYFVDDNKEE